MGSEYQKKTKVTMNPKTSLLAVAEASAMKT
jgi:hypothetical protein